MRNKCFVTLLALIARSWVASAHAGQHGEHDVDQAAHVDDLSLYSRASWDHRRRLDPASGDDLPHQPFCKVTMNEKEREVMALVQAEYESNERGRRDLAAGDIEIPVYFHGKR